jgi:hypothetical protein
MIATRGAIITAMLTGVTLELSIHALAGRREAWDSAQFWTVGLPAALVVPLAIGFVSRGCNWIWTSLMHLSPAALDAAIRLLESGTQTSSTGNNLEAAGTGSVTA